MFHFKSSNRLFVVLFSCLFFNLSIFADDASSKDDRLQKNVQKLSLLEHIKKQTQSLQDRHQEKDFVDDSSHFRKLNKKIRNLFSEKLQRSIDLIKNRLHEENLQPLFLTGAIDERQDRQDQSIIKDLQISAMALPFPEDGFGKAQPGSFGNRGGYENFETSPTPVPVDHRGTTAHPENLGSQPTTSNFTGAELAALGATQIAGHAINRGIDHLINPRQQNLAYQERSITNLFEEDKIRIEHIHNVIEEHGHRYQVPESLKKEHEDACVAIKKAQDTYNSYWFSSGMSSTVADAEKALQQAIEHKRKIEQTTAYARIVWEKEIYDQIIKNQRLAQAQARKDKQAVKQQIQQEAEKTQICDQLKKDLAAALTLRGRDDLAVSLDEHVECFYDKEQSRPGHEQMRLHSMGYFTPACWAQVIHQAASSSSAFSLSVKAGSTITELQNARNAPRLPKIFQGMSSEQIRAFQRDDTFKSLQRLYQLGKNFAGRIIETCMSYGYQNENRVLTVIDDVGRVRHFVFPLDDTRSPYEAILDATDIKWRKGLEDFIAKYDGNYTEREEKTRKTLKKLKRDFKEIEQKLKEQGIGSQEHFLPDDFQPARNEQGKLLRDKTGAYFNIHGERCSWNAKKQKWDITTLNGSHIFKQPSIFRSSTHQKVEQPQTSKMDACPPQEPTVFDHPKPETPDFGQGCKYPAHEPEKPGRQGCGSTEPVQRPIHTGHEPVEKLPERTSGCGGKVDDLQDQLTFYSKADKSEVKDQGQVNFELKKEGDLRDVDVKFREDNIPHIFRDEEGHLIDTPENRQRIVDLVKDPENYFGPDKHGNLWYGETLTDGTQLWGQVRKDKIMNAGLNEISKEYNEHSGLCDFDPAKQNLKK